MISLARIALRWWRRAARPLRLWWIQRRLTAKARAIDDNLRARPATLVTFDAALKDRYPTPGDRIKQYVIDERRIGAWQDETCPKLTVPPHYEDMDDSEAASGDGVGCSSVGETSWRDIAGHGSCRFCEGFAFAARGLPVMVDWFAARDRYLAEHPLCKDRDKLSDEIAPPLGDLRDNPILAFVRSRR